jgi:alpha/beta superfamily hydrolase
VVRLNNFIEGSAGRIELVVDEPEQGVQAIAVICHPHTLHGGTLSNKVIYQVARTFTALNVVTVRFNFRGAGEVDDLAQVVNWARHRWMDVPFWLAGFSFGAYVGLKAAKALAPDWLVTIAPPVNLYNFDSISVKTPNWLLIQGSEDEIVPASDVLAWAEGLQQKPQIEIVAEAGHFFHGRLNQIRDQLIVNAPRF